MIEIRRTGIERERFIVDPKQVEEYYDPLTGPYTASKIVTRIDILLPMVHKIAIARGIPEKRFKVEAYAGQIEDITDPCETREELRYQLEKNDEILKEAAFELKLGYDHTPFIADEKRFENLRFNTSADPRYMEMFRTRPQKWFLAGARIIGLHVNCETTQELTLKIFENGKEITDDLCRDYCDPRRLQTWNILAPGISPYPPTFKYYATLLKYIEDAGGAKEIYTQIRHKPGPDLGILNGNGVTEFRMFDETESVDKALACVDAVDRKIELIKRR